MEDQKVCNILTKVRGMSVNGQSPVDYIDGPSQLYAGSCSLSTQAADSWSRLRPYRREAVLLMTSPSTEGLLI